MICIDRSFKFGRWVTGIAGSILTNGVLVWWLNVLMHIVAWSDMGT